jgi:metal-responsive CopG/Arc/MetJ family transcriptional regulator
MEALTEKTTAFRPRPMGRPKLHVRATTVQLTDELLDRIAAIAPGVKDRSKFIREAVAEKLARDEPAELRKREKPSKG